MTDTLKTAKAVNDVLGSVLVSAGQINQIAGLALALIGIYKEARDKWKTEHPNDPTLGPFLTDADLIDALKSSALDVVSIADLLIAKYQTPTP